MLKKIKNFCQMIIFLYVLVQALMGWWYFATDLIDYIKDRLKK